LVRGGSQKFTNDLGLLYTIFVLRDLHPVLKYPYTEKNAPVVRELRNLTRELKRSKKTIILTSHALELPEELQEEVTVIDFPLPNVQEIEHLISQPEQFQVTGLGRERLVKACQGLSRAKIGRVLAKALAAKEQIIEQVVIDGLHRAFGTFVNGQRRDLTTEDILRLIEDTVPLGAIARSQIEDLKRWAAEAGARTAASNDTQLVDELKRYSQRGRRDGFDCD
jgi:hypothetical protein